ncbi:MAG: SIMPL domain-containing protein [Hyphomicrobiaceae bacterium]|nr:SIMPL domain-containing protein [Hyphomicrobiaceae bacterium]
MTQDRASSIPGLLLGAAVLAAWMAGPPAAAAEQPGQRRISISASATVTAEPDIALISTGVVSEAQTAREALERNTAAMRRLIEGLKAAGIEGRDIQTTSFNVEPRYEQAKDGRPPAIVGYRVLNDVRITTRDIGRLGEVLDRAVTLGANQIGGIQFEVSKSETLKDEARREAMANARRRAQLFAAAAGVELGEVLRIEEDVQEDGPRPVPYARALKASVPIERGTATLEARVSVTWALR